MEIESKLVSKKTKNPLLRVDSLIVPKKIFSLWFLRFIKEYGEPYAIEVLRGALERFLRRNYENVTKKLKKALTQNEMVRSRAAASSKKKKSKSRKKKKLKAAKEVVSHDNEES